MKPKTETRWSLRRARFRKGDHRADLFGKECCVLVESLLNSVAREYVFSGGKWYYLTTGVEMSVSPWVTRSLTEEYEALVARLVVEDSPEAVEM